MKLKLFFLSLVIWILSGCEKDVDFNKNPDQVEAVYNACKNSNESGYSSKTCGKASLILYRKAEKLQRNIESKFKKFSLKELIVKDCDTKPNIHTKTSECQIKQMVINKKKKTIKLEFAFINLENLKKNPLYLCSDKKYRCEAFKERLHEATLEREEANKERLDKKVNEISKLTIDQYLDIGYRNSCNDTFFGFLRTPELSLDAVMKLDIETGILYPDIPKKALSKDLVLEPNYTTCAAVEKTYPHRFVSEILLKRKKFDIYLSQYKKKGFYNLYKKAKLNCPSIQANYPLKREAAEIQYKNNEFCFALSTLMNINKERFIHSQRDRFVDTYRKYESMQYDAVIKIAKRQHCNTRSPKEYQKDISASDITKPTDNIFCLATKKALHNKYDTEMLKMTNSKTYAADRANECIKHAFSLLKIAEKKEGLTGSTAQRRNYENYINSDPKCLASKMVFNIASWLNQADYKCHVNNQLITPSKKCKSQLISIESSY